jgi:hypothetical protein
LRVNDTEKVSLLEQYNPTLVLLPQADGEKRRPGAWWRWPAGRGDYYPCTVDLVLDLVVRRDKPRKWRLFHWNPDQPWLFFKAPPPEKLTTQAGIKEALSQVEPQAVADWEMDISPVRSGHASRTWDAYQVIYQSHPAAKPVAVYGRCRETESRIALQYWYLYLYNDAANKHEGDWEMVSFELDKTQHPPRPVHAGYSGHEGGKRREWKDVKLSKTTGKPLVYVARGSHAAYFKAGKVKTLHIAWPKNAFSIVTNLLAAFNSLVSLVPFLGIWDRTAKLPHDPGRGFEIGEEVTPKVCVMPEEVGDAWWRALDCRWGSSHARLRDFIAPVPPWQQTKKWEQPIGWIRSLELDEA